MQKLINRLVGLIVLVLLGLGGVFGYNMTRSQMAAEVYRERLTELGQDYEALRSTYNQAIRRTAVTELIIEDGQVQVRIRTADGEERIIDTPLNPEFEIYVDYVVLDGRLWIRRVYDQYTAPGEGRLIDPELGEIEWDQASDADVGKAVYRRLSEGRWVVTVTGDGSLGLVRRDAEAPEPALVPPPEVRDYEQIEEETRRRIDDEVSVTEVFRHLFGG